MSKLNQVIAVVPTKKAEAKAALEKTYHLLQKTAVFEGQERVYKPIEDGGELLPSESQKVQFKVKDVINSVQEAWKNMFDVVMTNDVGNCNAKTDVIIDGKPVLENVPVTTLLFLEKQLVDLSTLVDKCPTLSDAEDWTFNNNNSMYVAKEQTTHRTKKLAKPIVLSEATKEHPAQVQLVSEDVTVGHWNTKKLSGAISSTEKQAMKKRIAAFKEAVVVAREKANSIDVEQIKQGQKVLEYIFN